MLSKVAIIGAGEVGSTTAYALLLHSVCSEVLMVDLKIELRDGQVQDLSNASRCENSETKIRTATHKEAGQCDIVVITAGSKNKFGETNLQKLYRNAAKTAAVINAMKPLNPNIILLVVTSPVDVMTSLAQKISGLPSSQVIGSGTYLDSVHLRGKLAEKIGVAKSSVNAWVLGEHGDSQFIPWSLASVGGIPLEKAFSPGDLNTIDMAEECKREGQSIIAAKGAISFGIGSAVAQLCSSILDDSSKVYPISYLQPSLGCCLSMPAMLGRRGIIKTLAVPLSDDEKSKLATSAKSVGELGETIRVDD